MRRWKPWLWVVGLLVLANAAVALWHSEWMRGVRPLPQGQVAEPERLKQQVLPEAVKLLDVAEQEALKQRAADEAKAPAP